jgi:alkylation response protein AidB-like acyl-CoA dehydrogenase
MFDSNENQEKRYQECVAFAEAELNHDLVRRDHGNIFDEDSWQKCADFGVLGWCMPEQYGGAGIDLETSIYMLEGLGYGCRDNGLTLGLNGQIWSVQQPLLMFGSEEQKQRFLTGLCKGELKAADGMTEPSSGSDAFSLQTHARKVDGGYVLNGEKQFLGLAPCADFVLVFANTNPDAGSWGISVFIVESNFEGFQASAPREKMGLRSNPMGSVKLDECFVPEENRLGPEGIGVSLFNRAMDWERGFIFSSHVGSMARQLDQCVSYARERDQFDQPIGKFQAVSHRIVDMKVRLEASRSAIYRVASLKQRGASATMEATLAKLLISEAFVNNSLDAIRIHGALGYMSDYEVERDLRDATGGIIYAGTSDIQKNIIASLMGL